MTIFILLHIFNLKIRYFLLTRISFVWYYFWNFQILKLFFNIFWRLILCLFRTCLFLFNTRNNFFLLFIFFGLDWLFFLFFNVLNLSCCFYLFFLLLIYRNLTCFSICRFLFFICGLNFNLIIVFKRNLFLGFPFWNLCATLILWLALLQGVVLIVIQILKTCLVMTWIVPVIDFIFFILFWFLLLISRTFLFIFFGVLVLLFEILVIRKTFILTRIFTNYWTLFFYAFVVLTRICVGIWLFALLLFHIFLFFVVWLRRLIVPISKNSVIVIIRFLFNICLSLIL